MRFANEEPSNGYFVYPYARRDCGGSLRGTFVIDPHGALRPSILDEIGRSVRATFRTVQAFGTGGVCPEDGKAGDAGLSV